MNEKQPVNQAPRTQVHLPFEKRPADIGTWSYDHRVGLCVTVIVYLLAGIVFFLAKIAIGENKNFEGIYIETAPYIAEQAIEESAETPEEMNARILSEWDFSDVRNRASNENATGEELNTRLRDAQGTNASEIYNEAAAVQARMQANRDAYAQGLAENEALMASGGGAGGVGRTVGSGGPGGSSGAGGSGGPGSADGHSGQDAKMKGRVTVSYSLINPLRNSEKLVVPAYQCEGGGQVVVQVTVDRSGNVTAAAVNRSVSSSDACMTSTAVSAARQSRFNVDPSAPEKHQGTITYIFIPQ